MSAAKLNGEPRSLSIAELRQCEHGRIREIQQARLLGAAMIDGARHMPAVATLNAMDFAESYRPVFRAMQELHLRGEYVDITSVASSLNAANTLLEMGGVPALITLVDEGSLVTDVVGLIAQVRKASARRRLESEIASLQSLVSDPGIETDTILQRLTEVAETTVSPVKKFNCLSSAELDAIDVRHEYLVEGILAARQPCILGGAKKSLKTTIATDLALSLGSGSKFLGRFYVPQARRVALMSGESGNATLQETARRIAQSKPWWNLSDYSNCLWTFDLPKLNQPQTKRELIAFIRDNGLDVLLIDPAYLAMDIESSEASNLFSMGKRLRELTDLTAETGCSVILIHHLRKSGRGDLGGEFAVPELDGLSWAGFAEWARQWILVSRRELYDPANPGIHRLWMTVGGSAGHSGLWGLDINETRNESGLRTWSADAVNASEAVDDAENRKESEREQRRAEREAKQLASDADDLAAAIQRSGPVTLKAARESLGLSGTRGAAAARRLLDTGVLRVTEVIKHGRAFDGLEFIGTNRDASGLIPINPDLSRSEHDGD